MLLSQRKRSPRSPLYLSLKMGNNLILIGTNKGFQVFSFNCSQKPRLLLKRERQDEALESQEEPVPFIQRSGGIGAFDVLESSNLFVLIAGGKLPKFSLEKVLLWNDAAQCILMEIEFSSPVKSAFFKRQKLAAGGAVDLLFILLTTKLVVYRIDQIIGFACSKVYEFDMYWNEFSALDFSDFTYHDCIFAFPARNKGQLQIVDITDIPSIPFTTICSGHDHAISGIAVSKSGNMVATCSSRGTLVRVWNTKSGTLRNELRRGTDEADIYSMAFDPPSTRLCVASDKGTVHIFNLNVAEDIRNHSPALAAAAYLPKYFTSEWSFSFCFIPYLTRCLVKFKEGEFETDTPYNTIYVACDDGSLYTLIFDPTKGGEASISSLHKYL